MSNINPLEECSCCHLPRRAHWGSHPIVAGVCPGFQSNMSGRTRAAADDLKRVLERLTAIADKCIPSDAASNADLAEADAAIAEAYSVLDSLR